MLTPNIIEMLEKFEQKFDYGKGPSDCLSADSREFTKEWIKDDEYENMYYGEVRKGTIVSEGKGICIFDDGNFYQGWFKND